MEDYREGMRAARQLKNLSMVIRATPSMSRWPTRAIKPPTSDVAVTSTSVPALVAFSLIVAEPLAKPGLPVASTLSRYEFGGCRTDSVTVDVKVPVTAATPIDISA